MTPFQMPGQNPDEDREVLREMGVNMPNMDPKNLVMLSNLGYLHDQRNGNVGAGLLGPAGNLYAMRNEAGCLSAQFLYEHNERWYCRWVLFSVQDIPCFETGLTGPYLRDVAANAQAGLDTVERAIEILRQNGYEVEGDAP